MYVYSVYLGDIFLKSFKSQFDAETLTNGLQIFLNDHNMDVDMVQIRKEYF